MNRGRSPGGAHPRSLQRRLWLSIAAVVAATAVIAAAISFVAALIEGEEQQDLMLRQVAALADHVSAVPPTLLQPRGRDVDSDMAIVVVPIESGRNDAADRPATEPAMRPARRSPTLMLPAGLAPGFHDLEVNGTAWRVLVTRGRVGRIAVAQEASVRFDSAVDGALTALLPVVALLPILLVLIGVGIRRALRPLHSLAEVLDASDPATLHSLPLEGVPRELRPFIVSINELIQRVTRALARERRFIADAAHELRTPIAVLQLQSDNLARVQSSEAGRLRLRDLREGIERMRSTVEQLLTLARLQHPGVRDASPIDPGEVLERVVGDYADLARQRGVDLVLTRNDRPTLHADTFQLYTLFRNAIDNALRHSPAKGRVEVEVRREVASDGVADVVVEVRDQGQGIPAADLERVFEPFERLQGRSEATGVGLGLAIMRSVAENLGGKLTLENRPQGGLCVRYTQREIMTTAAAIQSEVRV